MCIDTTSRLSIHWFTASLLTAFLISWPTSFLPKLVRAIAQQLLGEGFIALCLVDCYCQVFLGSPITPQLLSNVLMSDARETTEFLSAFMGVDMILQWRIFCLLLLAILLPISLFTKWELPVCNSMRYRISGIAILLLCLIIEIPTTIRYTQLFLQKNNMEKIEGLIFRHYHEEIPTPLHRIAFAYYSSVMSAHELEGIKHATYMAYIDSCSYLSPHIVLIIGESYNKHHSSLYGYQLPTAPLQQKRKEQGELFLFTDVVTPWNITSNVFLSILSLGEEGCEHNITDQPLFPILFRRAGYSVSFFSNQYVLRGFNKGATNQAGHFILADTHFSDSLFTYRNQRASKYDLGLVKQVEDYHNNQNDASRSLDIIHLIGQHFDYSMRYPHSHATFTTKDYKERKLDDNAKEIVMYYDNATRYNDTVLDSLITLYEQKEAVIIFVSDHGEEVYDDLPIHGRLFQEPTSTQLRNEFEVPMWIWCSQRYRTLHPNIVERIRAAAQRPFMTDGLPQILLNLAGISCCWSNEERNLISPKYQVKPRIVCGSVDYDKLSRTNR